MLLTHLISSLHLRNVFCLICQNMVEKLHALGHEPESTLQFGTPVRYDSRFLSFYPVTAEFSFTLDY